MLIMLLTGFSAGLPLVLTGFVLKTWLRRSGIDLSTIGFFSLAGLPYTLKFLWAPLVDRYVPPFLGRRRGWLLLTQIALAAGILGIALSDPAESLGLVGALALLVAFFSASQDIVIDAYRRELLRDEELGFGSSLFVNGYRFAMYVAQAGGMVIGGLYSFQATYVVMAALMGVGILTTLFAPEPETGQAPPKTLAEAVVGPFRDFFSRSGAITLLLFVLLYKLGDAMAGEMLSPFYVDLGYTDEQIGAVAKTMGLVGTLGGATLGGLLMIRIGISRGLWVFGVLQAVSTAGFVLLARLGQPDLTALSAVIFGETFTGGMGTAAYMAFMASITNKRFTATQYALLTSLMGVPRVIFGSFTGILATQLGWSGFFVFCTLIAAPGLLLLQVVAPWSPRGKAPEGETAPA
jgi:PAT family beta-lactamase induction signal transducer AmpG